MPSPTTRGSWPTNPARSCALIAARRPVLNDPRVGYVEGAKQLRAFVSGTAEWLRGRDAVVENVALTRTPTRTVEEVVLHLLADHGGRVELPVAVVSERSPDRTLK